MELATRRASPATPMRDLAEMVAKGALIRAGERRHARYHANIARRPVATMTIDQQGHLVEVR
jgi:hypothetical protein